MVVHVRVTSISAISRTPSTEGALSALPVCVTGTNRSRQIPMDRVSRSVEQRSNDCSEGDPASVSIGGRPVSHLCHQPPYTRRILTCQNSLLTRRQSRCAGRIANDRMSCSQEHVRHPQNIPPHGWAGKILQSAGNQAAAN